ncbi:fumarylacetoacetate hydrolase family protein [Kribbella swartbergensis]
MFLSVHADRVVLHGSTGFVDVADHSDGRFGPDVRSCLDAWEDFRVWAGGMELAAFPQADPRASSACLPDPGQIFAVGPDSRLHGIEADLPIQGGPVVSTKVASSAIGAGGEIEIYSEAVDWEVELAVVIGIGGRHVSRHQAWTRVAGLTVAQVSARDIQMQHPRSPQLSIGNSVKGCLSLARVLATPDEFDDPDDIAVWCELNGERIQDGRTSDLIFSVPEVIEYLSNIVELRPGDLILTSSPGGDGYGMKPLRFLRPGDTISIGMNVLGRMEHLTVASSRPCNYSYASTDRVLHQKRIGHGDLLDVDTVVSYLRQRGLVGTNADDVAQLSGGVSSVVIRVGVPTGAMIVKQAREKLDVADDWFADRARSHTEATALEYLRSVSPDRVPKLVLEDEEHRVLVMEAAPVEWTNLKSDLLTGLVDPERFASLGELLGQWQNAAHPSAVPAELHDTRQFDELRKRPYFEVSAQRLPHLGDPILTVIRDSTARHEVLSHGDFSPKNIVGGREPNDYWVLDYEVAHLGDPLFDVAFMSSHLLLKWQHLPAHRPELIAALQAFLDAYATHRHSVDMHRLSRLVGCLLIARVAGSSPVEYLSAEDRIDVVLTGQRLLLESPHLLDWTGAML